MPLTGLPPEFQLDAESIARRQRVAEMLMQQGMQPAQMPQGGRIQPRMSPLQPMAQMFSAYAGNRAQDQANTASKDLGQRYENFLQEGVQDYMRKRNGTGVQPDPQEFQQAADGMSPAPASAGPATDPRALAATAMLSRNPQVQALGKLDYANENKLDQPHTVAPGGSLVTGRGRNLLTQPPLHQIPETWQNDLPPGAKREPNDPKGVFRMKGASGVDDVYAMEFEGGGLKGYKKLDQDSGAGAASRAPYYSPVSTASGLWNFDHRSGQMVQIQDSKGQPIIKDTADPGLQGRLAAEKKAAQERAEAAEKARMTMGKTEQTTKLGLDLIDKMIGSEDSKVKPMKGFESYVGATLRPGFRFIDGTPEADFDKALKQELGQAFLTAYETLKGTGQITEKEGQEAKGAITRMSKAQSEAEFKLAARDFQRILKDNLQIARTKAATPNSGGPAGLPAGTTLKFDAQGNPVQ